MHHVSRHASHQGRVFFRLRSLARDQGGQAIIQILISVGIMGILMAAFASMMQNQVRETSALSQKLASTDLEKLLIASLADGSVCAYILNNPTKLTFDSTQLPQTITLPDPDINGNHAAIYTSIVAGPKPGPIAVQVASAVSAFSETLKAQSIQLQITSGSKGRYYGNWLVNFDPAGSVHMLKPAAVANLLIVDDVTSPTNATITACQGTGGGLGRFQAVDFHFPGEPPGGGFVTLPQATYPTVGGAFSPELLTNTLTFVPQGTRLDLSFSMGAEATYTNSGQAVSLRTYLHLQPLGSPDIAKKVGNMYDYPLTPGQSYVYGNDFYSRISMPVTPGTSVNVTIGSVVWCDASTNCPNANSAIFEVWSPVTLLIQEYY